MFLSAVPSKLQQSCSGKEPQVCTPILPNPQNGPPSMYEAMPDELCKLPGRLRMFPHKTSTAVITLKA